MASGSAAEVSITACGQTVPAGETGVLASDLACGDDPATFAVAVGSGATLDLAGHTLSGDTTGVRCTGRRCTVISSGAAGTILDMETAGIAVPEDHGKLTVSNIALVNCDFALLTNFTFGKVIGERVTLTGSGIGIQAGKIILTGLTATGNYRVVQARKTLLRDSNISASEDSAISGENVSLRNTSVTGSGSGIDLLTDRSPRLLGSTCDTSRVLSDPTQSWGVCSND